MCFKNKHIINLINQNKISKYNSVLDNKIYLKILLKKNLYDDFFKFINNIKNTKNIDYSKDINYITNYAKNYSNEKLYNNNQIIKYLQK